jgi:hypothetical protein
MGRAPRRADFSHPRPDFTVAGSFPQIVNFMNFGAAGSRPVAGGHCRGAGCPRPPSKRGGKAPNGP